MSADMAPDVRAFLDSLAGMPKLSFRDMGVEQARAIVRDVAAAFDLPPDPTVEVEAATISAPDGNAIPVRIYTPQAMDETAPLILYLHGGGWVTGDLDSYDSACRALATMSAMRLVSVGYRLAPEHPFPAAFDDALAVAQGIAAAQGMVLAGDSAGGNLAAAVALALAGAESPVRGLLLFYPVLDCSRQSSSYAAFAEGYLLEAGDMAYFIDCYVPNSAMRSDWRCSPLLSDALSTLPPTVIMGSGFDPLRDEARAFVTACRAAGVAIEDVEATGHIHGIVTLRAAMPSGGAALDRAIAALKRAVASNHLSPAI